MQRYIVRRFLQSLLSLLLLLALVFVVTRATGDPVTLIAPPQATEADLASLRATLGLDKPVPVQFGYYLAGVAKGDLGKSVRSRMPVMKLLSQRVPNSLKLAGAAMFIALLIAIPLGVLSAAKKGTPLDTLVRMLAVLGQSMPAFWLGLVLMEIFAVRLKLLPVAGMSGPASYVLPAFTLGWFISAGILRLLRSSMVDALDSEYIKLARIKGASESAIVWRHALMNSLIPVVSFAAIYFVLLLTAAVVVEVVFAWPGMGRLAYEAIMVRDFPIIQGVVLTAGVMVVVANLATDILYCYLDPRIRYA